MFVMMYRSISPKRKERQRLLAERWETLPKSVQTPVQIAGKSAIFCGATHHVMERCNFSCTCCYLGKDANKTEPLPFEEVKEQLDQLRAALGHGGKAQITAGEVTLLPLEDLGRIVAYGRSVGLDVMVMSHGQRFLDEPDYLIALVRDYGLRKISIHIDSTQRGRKGTDSSMNEVDLDTVRDAAAELVRHVREVTGLPLQAASTVTVTNHNLEEMADVMSWFLRNSDAFRLLSFQPVADVGRTRKGHATAILNEKLWQQIFTASARSFNSQPLLFGHPKCNNVVPLLIAQAGEELIIFESLRSQSESDTKMFQRVIEAIGGRFEWEIQWRKNISNILGMFFRNPSLLWHGLRWGLERFSHEKSRFAQLIKASWRAGEWPRFHPFLIIIHNFMNAEELQTEEGQERLDSCIFKLPVDGKLISMCEMNATEIRTALDRRQLQAKAQPKKDQHSCSTI